MHSLLELILSWNSLCIYSVVSASVAAPLSLELRPKSEEFVSLRSHGESHLMPGDAGDQRLPSHKTDHKHRNNQGRTSLCIFLCVCKCVKARWNIIANLPAWNLLNLKPNSALSQPFFINKEHCTSIQLMKYWFVNCIVRRWKAFKALSECAPSQLHQLLFFNGFLWKPS